MKELVISGKKVFLDDIDYDNIKIMSGWYVAKAENHNSNTDYVKHDQYGALHRYLLGVTDPSILIEHIDRNGLNNQRKNLRITTCSVNKRNSNTLARNKFNFNGLSFEKANGNRQWRIKVSYSTNETLPSNPNKKMQKTKSFGPSQGKGFNELTKEAVLFRIQKMREFGYKLDERSETIEKKCLEENPNMEDILGINFNIFEVEQGSKCPRNGNEKDIVRSSDENQGLCR